MEKESMSLSLTNRFEGNANYAATRGILRQFFKP